MVLCFPLFIIQPQSLFIYIVVAVYMHVINVMTYVSEVIMGQWGTRGGGSGLVEPSECPTQNWKVDYQQETFSEHCRGALDKGSNPPNAQGACHGQIHQSDTSPLMTACARVHGCILYTTGSCVQLKTVTSPLWKAIYFCFFSPDTTTSPILRSFNSHFKKSYKH